MSALSSLSDWLMSAAARLLAPFLLTVDELIEIMDVGELEEA